MGYTGSAPNQVYQRTDGVRTGSAVNVTADNNGVNNTAALADARENDLASAINLLWLRNGGNQPSADLPMNTHKFTGMAAGTARTDSLRIDQVQDGDLIYAEAGGTANAITLTTTPTCSPTEGMVIGFVAEADSSSTVTVDLNGGGAVALQYGGGALVGGEINNGQFHKIGFDGTQWQLLNPYITLALLGGQPLDADLTALAALNSTGHVVRTGSATYALRTLTAPAAGITVTDGDGVAGNPTLALANDLAALEGLSSTGMIARTGDGTASVRTVTAGVGVTVTNGDGVSGNPTIAAHIGGRRAIADITSGDTIVAGDNGKLVSITTGTGTLAFTAAATLGANFTCRIKNAGTGDVTLNPDGTEQIDGLTSWILYPGGTIEVFCDASNFFSVLLSPMQKTFNSSGTFTKPGVGTWAEIEGWGGGASGAKGVTNVAGAGGGGGAYVARKLLLSSVGTTETVTIGAGGAAQTSSTTPGNNGGNTTFGSLLTAYGGGRGGGGKDIYYGGNGGGTMSAPTDYVGGDPQDGFFSSGTFSGNASIAAVFGGGSYRAAFNNTQGGYSSHGGAAGGFGDATPGNPGYKSVYGGGGGGGGGDATAGGAGGTSLFGGNGGAGATGGAAATAGSQPAGGGGGSEDGTSGAGGAGRIIVRIY